jgi:hypothetical protein
LYGRKCMTPLYWDKTGERQFFGPDLIQEAEEQVRIIRENLRVAQTRQKSYADNRRRPLEFEEGDYVYLKVGELERWHTNSSDLLVYRMCIMCSTYLN